MKTSYNFETHIKQLCKKHNITVYKLAKSTHIGQENLRLVANGKLYPSIKVTQSLCDFFGVTSEQIVTVYPTTETLDHRDKRPNALAIKDALNSN